MTPKVRKALIELYEIVKWDLILLVIIFFMVFWVVNELKYSDIKDVISTLQYLSAAIFTIVGLWVGSLYPTAIESIVNDDVSYIKNTKDVPRIEKLIYVIVVSALVMLGTLVFYVLKSILGNGHFYLAYKDSIRIMAFTFVYFLCWLQLRCVTSMIISNLRFANNLHSKIHVSKLNHDD